MVLYVGSRGCVCLYAKIQVALSVYFDCMVVFEVVRLLEGG
jgi:hypothetical protein